MSRECLLEVAKNIRNREHFNVEVLSNEIEKIINDANIRGEDVATILRETLETETRRIEYGKGQRMKTIELTKERIADLDQFDDVARGMKSFMETQTGKHHKGSGNIVRTRQGVKDRILAPLMKPLNEVDGLLKRAKSGELNEAVFRHIIDGEEKALDVDALKFAKAVKQSNNLAYEAKRKAGYNLGHVKDYVVRTIHDPKRMRAMGKNLKEAKENWKKLAIESFAWEKVNTGDFTRDEYLDMFWKSRMDKDAKGFFQINDEITEVTSNAVSKRIEASRKVHFKDGVSAHKYYKAMGGESIAQDIVKAASKDAGQVAAARHFGPNPKTGFEKTIQAAKELAASKEQKWDSKMEKQIRRQFQLASSFEDARPEMNLWAKTGDVMRKITNLSKLGNALITTGTDIPFGAATLTAISEKNFLSTAGEIVANTSKFFVSKKQRMQMAEEVGMFMEDLIGETMPNKFMDEQKGFSKWLDKTHDLGMKMSGLPTQALSTKQALVSRASRDLAQMSKHSFDDLPKGAKQWLDKFGIDNRKWGVIKEGIEQADRRDIKVDMTTPEGIQELPDSAFKKYGFAKDEIEGARDDLSIAVSSYLYEVAETGSPTPRLWIQEIKGRANPNEPIGQLYMNMFQFKSFTLSLFNTMSAIKNTGKSLEIGGKELGNVQKLAQTMVSTTMIGYMVLAAKDVAKGREIRTPENVNDLAKVIAESMVQGGAGMIWMDVLGSDYTKNWKTIGGDIAGPAAAGVMTDLAVLGSSILNVDLEEGVFWDKKDTKRTLQLLERNAPKTLAGPILGGLLSKHFFQAWHDALGTGKRHKKKY